MKEKRKNPGIPVEHYINIVDISRETYKRNNIETIIDNDGILWLIEKHIEQRLDHNKLQ